MLGFRFNKKNVTIMLVLLAGAVVGIIVLLFVVGVVDPARIVGTAEDGIIVTA